MLKPIHRVACHEALKACHRLQMDLMAWLCDPSVGAADITQGNLKPPVLPTDIEADWLWGFLGKEEGSVALLERARTLASMAADDKRRLQEWVGVVSDVASQFGPNPPAWPAARPAIPDNAWKAFKELMEAFYKKGLYGGLPYADDGKRVSAGGVGYAHFVKAFREKHRLNPHPDAREVCVLCGGPLGQTPEVDHWINKGDYPLLSVGVDNLLPGCGDCNSTSNKGRKPVHSQGSFTDWFHPYFRHANGGIRLDYDMRTRSIAALAKNPADSKKVANLDKLLNLAGRWTREFKAEYVKQQDVLVRREQRRKRDKQPGQSQDEILNYIHTAQDDLSPDEPHYEVHSVLLSSLLDQARLAAWQTELELV